jgi:diguanylate cyclase (GGDEF)-like protein
MIRSTCPIIVQRVRSEYPDLVPFLAPVMTPLSAEVAYIRENHGKDVKIVHAGVCLGEAERVDATITFPELDQLFRARGVDIASQPLYFTNLPQERRRHLSLPGGLPLSILNGEPQTSRRFRKVRRDLTQLETMNKAVTQDGLRLGFVDILPCEGCLDHPLMGSREELFWRRTILDRAEPRRSPEPVLDPEVEVDVSTSFEPARNLQTIDEAAAELVVDRIGRAADGKPWDCGACGYTTCRKFASAFIIGRATYRQCPPYQERTAKAAQAEAAVDVLTGLSTFRVLQQRLSDEIARSSRSGDAFGILFADLDRFKGINDGHGHEAGNRVIKLVADVIRSAVRRSDIAARYGGDEFVVVTFGTELGGAMRVAEQVRRAVDAAGVQAGFAPGTITVSIGVSSYQPGPAEVTAAGLLELADQALYKAKAAGGNRVERGTPVEELGAT